MKNETARREIDSLDYYLQNHTNDYSEESHRAMMMAIKALEQTKWIPVSERLPEVDGRYLTTCSKIGKWEVDWNIWYNEPKPSWLWEQGVTAWMPLPEPYVPDTNDGKMAEAPTVIEAEDNTN